MNDDPKGREQLLRAKVEIEEVMQRYGMVGHYIIALPGQSETSLNLNAPWCVARLETVNEHQASIRVRALRKDYEGREDERNAHIDGTLSALRIMGLVLGKQALTLIHVTEKVAGELEGEFGPLELVRKQ